MNEDEFGVRLRPELARLLEECAERTGRTPEEVVARAVHAYLVKRKGRIDP